MEHKDAIIACFKSVGISLLVDSSEDYLLKVQDCPNLTVRDWRQALKGTTENPTVINNDIRNTIEVDDNEEGLLYTT